VVSEGTNERRLVLVQKESESMTEAINIVGALNKALHDEMEKDNLVIVLGEDVGKDGGVFRVTEGLFEKWPDRVIDTPLAETGIAGVSIGLAAGGMKPVAEIQFDGFMHSALDQMISHAGRIRNRSRGRFTCPMVLRAPYGGGIKALEHHSDSPEAYYVHTPGLKVVVPATPNDAYWLLRASIQDPDPVVFLEPKRVYRAIKEEISDRPIKLGEAQIIQSGDDVTVISWGAMVRTCTRAIEKTKDISVELINLRTLKPLDIDAITNSVKKTGRCVIVQEAPRTCGFASELIALINEKAFLNLEAPPMRVTGYDTVIPLAKMEAEYFPDENRVARMIEKAARF